MFWGKARRDVEVHRGLFESGIGMGLVMHTLSDVDVGCILSAVAGMLAWGSVGRCVVQSLSMDGEGWDGSCGM
jgi:hypothetical protein